MNTVAFAQTFINQVHQERFMPLSTLEEDPFWDTLTQAPAAEQLPKEEIPPSSRELTPGQGILDDFDIKEFRSHIIKA